MEPFFTNDACGVHADLLLFSTALASFLSPPPPPPSSSSSSSSSSFLLLRRCVRVLREDPGRGCMCIQTHVYATVHSTLAVARVDVALSVLS